MRESSQARDPTLLTVILGPLGTCSDMERQLSKQYLREFEQYVVMEPYPFVVDIRKSYGSWLVTVDGEEILDWAGYYGSKLIGHNHPGLYEQDYVERLIAAANNKVANPDFLTPECLAYYRQLYHLAPKCMTSGQLEVYAINSGAEAVENMLKYFINLYDRKRTARCLPIDRRRFIYFDQAFHGRTIYALNITRLKHAPVITKDFQGIIENIEIPFPAIESSRSEGENRLVLQNSLDLVKQALIAHKNEIVGIIVEPIQGAGGHRVAYPEFFQRLSEFAHEHEVYLGFDEVQTAGGQTGEVFAIDSLNLPHPPQGVACGKKFGCGVVYMLHPMSDLGVLDSTWGGTLADMVRFCQEWKIVEREHLIQEVPQKTAILQSGLEELVMRYPRIISNIRGMGLYQGFTVCSPELRNRLLDLALEQESLLLLGAATDSVRLRPVLDVGVKDISLMLTKLEKVLKLLAE